MNLEAQGLKQRKYRESYLSIISNAWIAPSFGDQNHTYFLRVAVNNINVEINHSKQTITFKTTVCLHSGLMTPASCVVNSLVNLHNVLTCGG